MSHGTNIARVLRRGGELGKGDAKKRFLKVRKDRDVHAIVGLLWFRSTGNDDDYD